MTSSNACVTGSRGWLAGLAVAAACTAVPAAAQQPSQEQISAIRSNCRSDYMAHCSSVPPGGAESLQCLERNLAQLSGACRSAVSAAVPKPAAPVAPAAASAPPPQQAPAHATAAPSAPPPPHATSHPPAPHTSAPHAPPPPRPPATAAAPPAAPPALIPLAPMPPLPLRVEMLLLRICAADRSTHCSVVQPGGGRIIACLADNEPALMPNCKEAMAEAKKYD